MVKTCFLKAMKVLFAMVVFPAASVVAAPPLLSVESGLFDAGQADTLGLTRAPGLETFTVFAPTAGENHYNHGAVVTSFQGRLYVQWQSSARDEDAPDTDVVFASASASDPAAWTPPAVLARARQGSLVTSGGWWTDGETLVAFINVWPGWEDGLREGHAEYIISTDGESWSAPRPVLGAGGKPVPGVIEQDPHGMADGRIIGAFHVAPSLTAAPYYTDSPLATDGWTRGTMENLPSDGTVSRELEPSLFVRPDGAVVMIFRDQMSSFQTLASISHDWGETWTTPALSPFPDARTKQSAGNLPDGSVFRVGNPNGNKARFPLVVSLSGDGQMFDRAYLMRAGGADM
ncbi:exo-alpha-sialidase, partial [Kordiimonas sp.]|uniref:exo-alpha-sialidase n=1 Tax=Kordiimonas sp. TaxID=1970157 RepID=UPI003A9038DC